MLDNAYFSENHRITEKQGWKVQGKVDHSVSLLTHVLQQAPESHHHRDYPPHRSAGASPSFQQCFLINVNLFGFGLSLCFPVLPTRYRQQILLLS